MSKKDTGRNALEENLEKLEKIVNELDSGQITIDQALVKFEKGVELYKKCKKALGEVEKKVKILTDELKEEDFES